MTRTQLEHIIRAAGAITNSTDLVVIGSQAVLGQFPDAPEELRVSSEADVFPRHDPAAGDLIDGSIGEDSPFHRTFGYYAHGVEEKTAVLPDGWRERLVRVESANKGSVRGWCLDVHDLAISKYAQAAKRIMTLRPHWLGTIWSIAGYSNSAWPQRPWREARRSASWRT